MRPTPEARAVRALTRLCLHNRPPATPAERSDHRICRHWGWRDNIVGLAVSRVRRRRRVRSQIAVPFFVRRKLSEDRLSPKECIPQRLRLRTVADEVQTDVVELRGRVVAQGGLLAPAAAFPPASGPARPGRGLGHWRGFNGTLGLIVRTRHVTGSARLELLARAGAVWSRERGRRDRDAADTG